MKHLARRFQKDISFLLFCGISRETRGSQMTKSFGYQSGRNPEAYNMKFYTFFQSILIAFLALSIESVYIEDGAVATAQHRKNNKKEISFWNLRIQCFIC